MPSRFTFLWICVEAALFVVGAGDSYRLRNVLSVHSSVDDIHMSVQAILGCPFGS